MVSYKGRWVDDFNIETLYLALTGLMGNNDPKPAVWAAPAAKQVEEDRVEEEEK